MDDLSSKINEIFSSPEGMEKIKNLVNMFSSTSGGEENAQTDSGGTPHGGSPPKDMPDFDPELLMNMKKAMDIIKKGDPRIDLLLALRENLSDPRRKKVDEAIQIMRVISLLPLLREQGFFNG